VKLFGIIVVLISTVALRSAEPTDSLYPHWFGSRERAESYAGSLFAGGDVDVLRVADKDILVLYVHGSGVPDIGIAAYRRSDGMWELAATFRPKSSEPHRAIVSGKEVLVVGEKTKQKWRLLRVD
jgi:hypothetical protein